MNPQVAAAWDTTLSAMIARHSGNVAPFTFPMRPVTGGNLDVARNPFGYVSGYWLTLPKYNGWMAQVHIESGAMFNRHGKRLSIEKEFEPALAALRVTLDAGAFKWAVCEALERRHNVGRGCLIVLDVVPEPDFASATYLDRRGWLAAVLPLLPYTPDPRKFPLISMPPIICDTAADTWREDMRAAWQYLKNANDILTPNVKPLCRFYEGAVNWRALAPYMIQLRSDNLESPALVKHRWEY